MAKQGTLHLDEKSGALRVSRIRLEVLDGQDVGLRQDFGSDRIAVGTAPGNDLLVTDPAVSGHHFEITVVRDGCLLRDLDSTNGTRVEGLRAREVFLESGARLDAGRTTLQFDALSETTDFELASQSTFGALLGKSAAMRRIFAILQKIAPKEVTVLVTGESGTGKELAARALHDQSPRRDGPFVVVDCGAMPHGLMESEILGHERGSFTGAQATRAGAFERAHGGTLFLDEIGELPLELQPKLLRVLEGREVTRVGGSAPRKVDVRVLAATNRDLRAGVNRGDFRGDLYYRLSVVELRLPPLRERAEDIRFLVEHFVETIRRREGVPYQLEPGTTARLMRHSWPGNVRELRNFIERSVSLSDGRVLSVDPDDVAFQASAEQAPAVASDREGERMPFTAAKRAANEEFERHYLKDLFERTAGNVTQAARDAQMDRAYLAQLLKKYGFR